MAGTEVKMRRKTLELCRKYWNCQQFSSDQIDVPEETMASFFFG
jgi:hypothetical protein